MQVSDYIEKSQCQLLQHNLLKIFFKKNLYFLKIDSVVKINSIA